MKKQTLTALTNAHAWVGLVISTVLFIVFLAGSFSLFRDNIIAWERDPHFAISDNAPPVGLDAVVATVQQNYDVDMHHRFFLYTPSEKRSHYEIYFAEEDAQGNEIDHGIVVSKDDATILGDASEFNFGNFLYVTHVDLNIPVVGDYLVGFVTLFFFVALLSGVVIHWRKIFKSFFSYRKDGKRDKWLDAHNVIGVMGLPFHIMYALTGLIFNLVIIYQIAYALILYQGDQTALLKDAGYDDIHLEEVNRATPMKGLDLLHQKAINELGDIELNYVGIEHFGDESSSVTFSGDDPSQFSVRKEIKYHIASGDVLYKTLDNYDNNVRVGLGVIASLHFGDFAGYGLRVLFFMLGIGTCYIILTGNLLWIEKRAKNKRQSQFGLHFVKAMTAGGFIGAMLAVAVGFAAARFLPVGMSDRADIVTWLFYVALSGAVVLAFSSKHYQHFSVLALRLTAIVLLCALLLDWFIYFEEITALAAVGKFDVFIVQAILALFGGFCWIVATHMAKPKVEEVKTIEHDAEPVTV